MRQRTSNNQRLIYSKNGKTRNKTKHPITDHIDSATRQHGSHYGKCGKKGQFIYENVQTSSFKNPTKRKTTENEGNDSKEAIS